MDQDKNGHRVILEPKELIAAHKPFQPEAVKLPEQMPKEMTILEAHNKMVVPIVTAIIQPIIKLGGTGSDVMLLLESIIVGTIGTMTMPEGNNDEKLLAQMSVQVLGRLKIARKQQADAKAKQDNAAGQAP
jgi:hypothetical protein